MLFKILAFFSIAFLSSCSLQQPLNAWQYKSVTAFEKYQQYYLENHTILADSERKKAITFAKQSAHLNTLARVYLGDCAIQHAALNPSKCIEFQEVSSLVKDTELNAYFDLLTGNLTSSQIPKLPQRYQAFARAYLKHNPKMLRDEIMLIPEVSSRLIAASLVKSQLDLETLRTLIDQTAVRGYQLASIRWMTYLASITPNPEESKALKHKISLMTRLH